MLAACAPLTCQTPNATALVNAASYQSPVAPGSIASLFGTFPVASPASAAMLPLPGSLSGISVLLNGSIPAALFYVSSGQINLQVPWELTGASEATLTVGWNGDVSEPLSIALAPSAPAIFGVDAQGSGQGAILDIFGHLVDSTNPAAAGITAVAIYCTGLGSVSDAPMDGAGASTIGFSTTPIAPSVTIGGVTAQVLFSGLAPGTVGEYQVNAIVPATSALGDAVPVTIAINGVSSNTVTMAVEAPTADQLAQQLVTQMTQDEKLQLLYGAVDAAGSEARGAAGWVPGIPRLGIPSLYLADGSVGVGNAVGQATALPSAIASAASWDLNQAYKYGTVIGAELRGYGINLNLGGNVNLIGREPRDGRSFETKGEDPILAGKVNAAHIQAIQDQHVIGCAKHFALNDQETGRTTANAEIDERSARESDLLAFEISVKDSGAQSVMCSYNLVNSVYACENPFLLTEALKGDWGFLGFVMSDWWATHSTVAAALAGLDQEQPDNAYFGDLGAAVASGQVPQARIDDMVTRILRAMFATGAFTNSTVLPIDWTGDASIAQEMEEQGAVLLRNASNELPLNASALRSLAVIGSHADIAVLSGGGSAQVTPTGGAALAGAMPCPPCWAPVIWDPSSPLDSIRNLAPNVTVTYDDGTNQASAAALAASCDRAIVFVSQWASEGMDLPSLNFTDFADATPVDQDSLVEAVAAANPHTIVVLENGGAQVMPWVDQVSAILEAWYPGQNGGPAIANLLFGVVNPSGKLPVTFPASVSQLPRPEIPQAPDESTPFPVPLLEGFNVGYKWYAANHLTPLFPFGFGLSYTDFAVSDWSLATDLGSDDPEIEISYQLSNTGPVAGAQVVQVYLALPADAGEQLRLVGWQKTSLAPGANESLTIAVHENDSSHPFGIWDTSTETWQAPSGTYEVYAGTSSSPADLTLIGSFQL